MYGYEAEERDLSSKRKGRQTAFYSLRLPSNLFRILARKCKPTVLYMKGFLSIVVQLQHNGKMAVKSFGTFFPDCFNDLAFIESEEIPLHFNI